jgi:hypothetical protein
LPHIPKLLKELISASAADYYRILEEQVRYLSTIENLISDNTLPERYLKSFYALLQDTPIEEWKHRLSGIYASELEAVDITRELSGEYFSYYWKISDLADAQKEAGDEALAVHVINERDSIAGEHLKLTAEISRLASSGVPLKKAVSIKKGEIEALVQRMKAIYDEAMGQINRDR